MRIIIDLQGAQSTSLKHGAGGHAVALAQAMARLRAEHEIVIAINGSFVDTVEPIRAAFDDFISQDNIRVWSMPTPAAAANKSDLWRRKTAEILREEFLNSLQPDVVHITGMFEGFENNAVHSIRPVQNQFRTVVTVYEPLRFCGDSVTGSKSMSAYETFYRGQLAHLHRADSFFCVSEFARMDVLETLGVAADRCVNIAAAVGSQFVPAIVPPAAIERLRKKFGINRMAILCGDAFGERNIFLRIIKAFSLLPPILRKSHQLVVVADDSGGVRSECDKSLQLFGLSPDCVVITGAIGDDELIQLYRSCVLFVASSVDDGFGFATLEAISCGAPVIGANTLTGAEILCNSEALFDPLDEAGISEKLAAVLYSEEHRNALITRGLVQAKKFSWDKSAAAALVSLQGGQRFRAHAKSPEKFQAVIKASSLGDITSNQSGLSSSDTELRIIQKVAAIRSAGASESDWFSISRAITINHPEPDKPRLLVDISELVHRDAKTGIQRVVRSILMVLLTDPPAGFNVRPVYLCTNEYVYKYADDFVCKLMDLPPTGVQDSPANWLYRDVFLGLDLQHEVVLAHQAVYAHMRRFGVKVYFVVYDLLPIFFPTAFRKGTDEAHEKWLGVLARSDGVVAISRTVADEVLEWMAFAGPALLRPLKIGWFHLGADVSGSVPSKGMPANSSVILQNIALRPAFLTVGTLEPRKGHLQTLVAFEMLWAQGVDVTLVIVGKNGWSVDLLVGQLRTHRELGKRLFWLDGVSDEYLERVYASCACLIAASEGEGFGLPLIEAAQHSLPIIVRDIPVFREVAGEDAHYFENNLDPSSISGSVTAWMGLNADAGNISRKPNGIKQLTWKQSAAELMAVVLGGNWYKTSSPDGVHRFWGSSNRLQTNVGRRVGREMVSTGQIGYLIFGPYISLVRGAYQISVTGTIGANGMKDAFLEAACNSGQTVLGKCDLHEPNEVRLIASLDVVLHINEVDFEIRIWVNALSDVSVAMVTVSPI